MTDVALADIPLARDLVPTDRRMLPCSIEDINEGADIIQAAGGFVSPEIRKDRGACVAIAYMSALHGTDLISTASQAYAINGRLAWMAQYVNALVQRRLEARPTYAYQGQGPTRCVQVTATPKRGAPLTYTSPQVGQIKVKNSPNWHVDVDQQLSFYGIRAWARRHMPDVLLGIYAVEELQQITIRDVTPTPNLFDAEADLDAPEDAEVTPFEPSGGFVTDTTPYNARLSPEQIDAVPDDILAWSETMKADASEAEDPAQLQALWDGCDANRRKLWRTERIEHEALELAFKDRLDDLTRG